MYKHSCGATVSTIAAAFVHLVTDCPLEERPAPRPVLDPDVERIIGRRPRQLQDRIVSFADLDTRITRR